MSDYQVFLSHSVHDRPLVEKVLSHLRSQLPNLDVWVDFEALKPGQDWAQAIVENADSASLFLIFGTKAAFESRWVQHEIGIALSKRILEKIPLIILAIDPQAIPADLARYQYIDFRDFDAGIKTLVQFLSAEYGDPEQTETHHLMYRLPPGTVMNFFDCPSKLKDLHRAELRSRLSDKLSRQEIAILWYDALGKRMDDEIPGQGKANCVVELLVRSEETDLKDELIKLICAQFPRVAIP